jgi:hypothetical protein
MTVLRLGKCKPIYSQGGESDVLYEITDGEVVIYNFSSMARGLLAAPLS